MKKEMQVMAGLAVSLAIVLAAVLAVTGAYQIRPMPVYAAAGQYDTPNFIQVGKVYSLPDPELQRFTILQIDKSGWVQIKTMDNEIMWLNLGVVRIMKDIVK
jgi:hypothetical protein